MSGASHHHLGSTAQSDLGLMGWVHTAWGLLYAGLIYFRLIFKMLFHIFPRCIESSNPVIRRLTLRHGRQVETAIRAAIEEGSFRMGAPELLPIQIRKRPSILVSRSLDHPPSIRIIGAGDIQSHLACVCHWRHRTGIQPFVNLRVSVHK